MTIRTTSFGHLPPSLHGGAEIHAVTLSRAGGREATIITWGAALSRLVMPDRTGALADIVIGFDDLAGYADPTQPYLNAICGRIAGRVSAGRLPVQGTVHRLAINNPPNHLHGGLEGFDKRVWSIVSTASLPDRDEVALRLVSPDGDQGYPGAVDLTVTYGLSDDGVLSIDYHATVTKTTPLCVTNHAYFNLAGQGRIDDHHLQVHADRFSVTDHDMTPLGRFDPVAGANDLTTAKRLGDIVPQLHEQHGDAYVVRRQESTVLVPVAVLSHPPSGRRIAVESTEPMVQFYTSRFLDGRPGKAGRPLEPFTGICLECQGFSDALTYPALGDILIKPGQVYRQQTRYRCTAE